MAELRAWLVRAGSDGAREQLALESDVVAIGWGELGDLTGLSRPELAEAMQEVFPAEGQPRMRNWIGQVWSFVNTVQPGDLVVLPSKFRPMVAIGRIIGEYTFNPDAEEDIRHSREVEWLNTDVPRTEIGQDLLNSLGSLLTVCRISRNNAAERLLKLATEGTDPGWADEESDAAAEPGSDSTAEEPMVEPDTDQLARLEQIARDAINKRIAKHFPAHRLSDLVAAILQAQGMTTYVAPDGKDGGIDVLAGSGPLGMNAPKICVQVKFTKAPADVKIVRELEGVMTRVKADQGLLVSWSGVTRDAERELQREFFKVRAWNADDVFGHLTAVYDRLPPEIQAELPLKRIWTIAGDS